MQKPIADIFTWPADDPQLIGGKCKACSAVCFPIQTRCPRCGKGMEQELLPKQGKVITWTVQGFPPVVPYAGDATGKNFVPFGMALVQLGDVVRVEGRLTENDPDKIDFGMQVELRIVPFYVDDNGDEIMTFAFAPVGDGATTSN